MMANWDFAEWLLAEIKKRGWTAAEFARQADLPNATVSRVLNRQRKPGAEFCHATARALGYDECFVFWKAGLIRRLPPSTPDPHLARLRRELDRLPLDEQEAFLEEIFALLDIRLRRTQRRNKPSDSFRPKRHPSP